MSVNFDTLPSVDDIGSRNEKFHPFIHPYMCVFEGPLEDETELNRIDMDELLDHQHLLDYDVRQHLELVRNKPNIYPERYFDPNYLPNSTLLLASRYPGSKRYAFCGVPTPFNPRGVCRDHRFCPYCNYLVRERAVRTYVPAFDMGTWHFVTLSFQGNLPFDSMNIGSTIDLWDACKSTLASLHTDGLISGVHWTEEIAILSFLPLRVMPHVHALVDAPAFGDPQLQHMLQHLSNWRNQAGEPIPLVPDIDVRPIATPRSLLDRTRYAYKPIDLARPYGVAWVNHIEDNRGKAWELNSQAREMISGIFEARKKRDRMRSKGTLEPRTKGFIGIPKDERANYSQYIRDLQGQPAEYEEELLDGADADADPVHDDATEVALSE